MGGVDFAAATKDERHRLAFQSAVSDFPARYFFGPFMFKSC